MNKCMEVVLLSQSNRLKVLFNLNVSLRYKASLSSKFAICVCLRVVALANQRDLSKDISGSLSALRPESPHLIVHSTFKPINISGFTLDLHDGYWLIVVILKKKCQFLGSQLWSLGLNHCKTVKEGLNPRSLRSWLFTSKLIILDLTVDGDTDRKTGRFYQHRGREEWHHCTNAHEWGQSVVIVPRRFHIRVILRG